MPKKATAEPKVIYDYDPRNLPPECLQAIGLVALASAQTESVLEDFIGGLLNIDVLQAMALTTHLNNRQKNDIIRTLAELEAPNLKELDKVDELMDAVNKALPKRNAIVHCELARHPKTGKIFRWQKKARGSLDGKLIPISIKEIENDASLIYEAGMDIQRFMIHKGLSSHTRTTPLRAPPKRGKKARQDRNNSTNQK